MGGAAVVHARLVHLAGRLAGGVVAVVVIVGAWPPYCGSVRRRHHPLSPAASPWPPVETTANSARILWRTLLEPLATYALVVVVLMFLACAVFGTALNHVVIERAEQR